MKTHEEKYYDIAEKKSSWNDEYAGYLISFLKRKSQQGQTLLEVGCGEGSLVDHIPETLHYSGVDISEYAITNARNRYDGRNAEFIVGGSTGLMFEDQKFDYVVSRFALEHFNRPRYMIDEMVRVLKPGGVLMLMAPNLEMPLSELNAVRHWSTSRIIALHIKRTGDYIKRLFGVFAFRTVEENYTNVTGKYEKLDDDLCYICSTYEVVGYLTRKHNFSAIHANKFLHKGGIVSFIKKLVTYLPAMEFYGDILFLILEKGDFKSED